MRLPVRDRASPEAIGNMLVAGLVGTGIPFLLRLLKIDPAALREVGQGLLLGQYGTDRPGVTRVRRHRQVDSRRSADQG